MSQQRFLPAVPAVRLEVIEDLSPAQPPGFLRLVRRRLVAHGPDGSTSAPFIYDEVQRNAIDAVVVAAYYRDAAGKVRIYLRSATRPPVVLRPRSTLPLPELAASAGLWELVAGLIEESECTPSGVVECAQRELAEEIGFEVEVAALKPLGKSTVPVPGMIGERHFFFCVEVDPSRQKPPSLDGSALEQLGAIIDVPLSEAMAACEIGEIEDSKTELALRRLSERLERER